MSDLPPEPPIKPAVAPPDESPGSDATRRGGSYQFPSDYYDSPPPHAVRTGRWKWVLIGCGGGGCLLLIAMFIGGSLLMNRGMGGATSWFLTQIEHDLNGKLTTAVTPVQRQKITESFQRLRDSKKSVMEMPKLLQEYKEAVSDQAVDSAEADRIIAAADEAGKRH